MYLTQGRKEGRGKEGGGETVRAGKERKGEGRREREGEREVVAWSLTQQRETDVNTEMPIGPPLASHTVMREEKENFH